MFLRTTTFVLALAGCATSHPTDRRLRDTPPQPPTPIALTLDVEASWIGVRPAGGGHCASPISGSITITTPSGAAQTVAVAAADMVEQICVGCTPVPGMPGSCDNACTSQPRSWIQLVPFPFAAPGDYTITGDTLAVACGPLRVTAAYVRVNATAGLAVFREPPPAPLVVAAPPPSAPPPPTTDATKLRSRFSPQTPVMAGRVEALVMPTGLHQKKRGLTPTKWGDLRTSQTGTAYRMFAGATGPYWIQHRAANDARPHILSIEIEDETDEARRAGQSGGAIARTWVQLDGAPPANQGAVSIDVSAALDDGAARWTKFLGEQRRPIEEALAAANRDTPGSSRGTEKVEVDAEFRPTWVSGSKQLVVLYRQRTTRWTEHKVKAMTCPRNRPGSCTTRWVRAARSYHADVAAELIYDQTGTLVAEHFHSARSVPGE